MSEVCRVNEAIILAGGFGTRLRPVVSEVPKPMAPVAGRPFLSYVLDYLEAQGIRRVILSVGYRNEIISNFFGRRHGSLNIDYSVEEEPLGTGGGLKRALELPEGPFVFGLNGDTFLRLNYRAMAGLVESRANLALAIALRAVEDAGRYGRAVLSGERVQGFAASGTAGPGLVNAGVYLMSRDLFERFPVAPKFSFEADFMQARAAQVLPFAFVCDEPFIDIGVPESYRQAQDILPDWTSNGPNAAR